MKIKFLKKLIFPKKSGPSPSPPPGPLPPGPLPLFARGNHERRLTDGDLYDIIIEQNIQDAK
jgi:hypothetical protein